MVIGNYGATFTGKVNDKKTTKAGHGIEKQPEVFIPSSNNTEVGLINPGKIKAIQTSEVRTEGETGGVPKNLSALMNNYGEMLGKTSISVAMETAGHLSMAGLDFATEEFNTEAKGLTANNNGITVEGSGKIPSDLQSLKDKFGSFTVETNTAVALSQAPYLGGFPLLEFY